MRGERVGKMVGCMYKLHKKQNGKKYYYNRNELQQHLSHILMVMSHMPSIHSVQLPFQFFKRYDQDEFLMVKHLVTYEIQYHS